MDQRAPGGTGAGERAPAPRTGLNPPRTGASFSHRRARARGLDPRTALRRLLDLGLSPVRLSTFWDEVDRSGYGPLDEQLAEVERAGRDVVLTVGMKAQGWPEFAIPDRLAPDLPAGSNAGSPDAGLRSAVLELVEATVARYRDMGRLVAWQVENEPLNPSGPRRWWIGPELLREEIATARRADPTRPLLLNVFAAFNARLDVASSRHGVRRLLGLDAHRPEAETLALLERGDILGLDVYRRIVHRGRLAAAGGWGRNAARWRRRAVADGKEAWIVEAQAEPWEPDGHAGDAPRTCRADELDPAVRALRGAGYGTILLWGVEHWLAREAAGDPSWLRAVDRLLAG